MYWHTNTQISVCECASLPVFYIFSVALRLFSNLVSVDSRLPSCFLGKEITSWLRDTCIHLYQSLHIPLYQCSSFNGSSSFSLPPQKKNKRTVKTKHYNERVKMPRTHCLSLMLRKKEGLKLSFLLVLVSLLAWLIKTGLTCMNSQKATWEDAE